MPRPTLVLSVLVLAAGLSTGRAADGHGARLFLQAKLTGIHGKRAEGYVALEVPTATPGRVVGRGAAAYLEHSLDAAAGSCVATNGCGLHVHSGESCDTAPLQGGHFYDTEAYPVDPWRDVGYRSTTYVDPHVASGLRLFSRHARTTTFHHHHFPRSSIHPARTERLPSRSMLSSARPLLPNSWARR